MEVPKKNIILGEKLSPDRERKKEPKHTLIEFGLYRGLILVTILSVLSHFGTMTKKQLIAMVRRKLLENVPSGRISNMVRLLNLWGYVGKERVTKRLHITEKGEQILARTKDFVERLVLSLFDKEFPIQKV